MAILSSNEYQHKRDFRHSPEPAPAGAELAVQPDIGTVMLWNTGHRQVDGCYAFHHPNIQTNGGN